MVGAVSAPVPRGLSEPVGAASEPARRYSAVIPTIEFWLFVVTNPRTGKRRRTTYRLTMDEARVPYVDPEPVPGSPEQREVNEQAIGHDQTLGPPATK